MLIKKLKFLTSVFSKRRSTQAIKVEELLWNNKPLKEKSVLLWDLENIPFSRLADIKKVVKYTPDELYIVTKQHLGEKLLKKIHQENFKVLDAHKTISDSKIISIMKLYRDRENMVLVSSDSDFAKEANSYLKKHKLHWIVVDSNKKAIVMRVDLASSNLTISTLENKKYKLSVSQKMYFKTKHKQVIMPAKIERKDNKLKLYTSYYQGKVSRAIKKIRKLYRKARYHYKQLLPQTSKEPTIEIEANNPAQGKRELFRRDYKGKRVKAGLIQFNANGEKILKLYKKLSVTYEMPPFTKLIRFYEFSEVQEFIHFNSNEEEYYLNEFERKFEEYL